MFSFFACFSNLEAVDTVSFFKTLKTTKNIGTQICMFYYETVGTLKQCSIQEQLEEQLMTITYGPT